MKSVQISELPKHTKTDIEALAQAENVQGHYAPTDLVNPGRKALLWGGVLLVSVVVLALKFSSTWMILIPVGGLTGYLLTSGLLLTRKYRARPLDPGRYLGPVNVVVVEFDKVRWYNLWEDLVRIEIISLRNDFDVEVSTVVELQFRDGMKESFLFLLPEKASSIVDMIQVNREVIGELLAEGNQADIREMDFCLELNEVWKTQSQGGESSTKANEKSTSRRLPAMGALAGVVLAGGIWSFSISPV